MNEHDKKILETFEKALPNLSERQKDRLLWIGEGILLKTEEQEPNNSMAS